MGLLTFLKDDCCFKKQQDKAIKGLIDSEVPKMGYAKKDASNISDEDKEKWKDKLDFDTLSTKDEVSALDQKVSDNTSKIEANKVALGDKVSNDTFESRKDEVDNSISTVDQKVDSNTTSISNLQDTKADKDASNLDTTNVKSWKEKLGITDNNSSNNDFTNGLLSITKNNITINGNTENLGDGIYFYDKNLNLQKKYTGDMGNESEVNSFLDSNKYSYPFVVIKGTGVDFMRLNAENVQYFSIGDAQLFTNRINAYYTAYISVFSSGLGSSIRFDSATGVSHFNESNDSHDIYFVNNKPIGLSTNNLIFKNKLNNTLVITESGDYTIPSFVDNVIFKNSDVINVTLEEEHPNYSYIKGLKYSSKRFNVKRGINLYNDSTHNVTVNSKVLLPDASKIIVF